ncbi:hypothetical protein Cgig2_008302 [Carnegiea gigantea]|uniref:poly(A)-specific ribonuclease n=1 Tax=Carnegiea gigantea TaxID=171969 RepID=A0A9Q1GR50_9CARY|nr:hypothetical protein Cgig2_008302 [Carnegiea gigantea]
MGDEDEGRIPGKLLEGATRQSISMIGFGCGGYSVVAQLRRRDVVTWPYARNSQNSLHKFPRLIRNTPRKAAAFAREDVKFNVARSIVIHVGVTLSDDEGHIAGTWQFNLVCGDMVVDYVNCLRGQYGGVKFVKAPWMRLGVPHMVFVDRFRELVQEFHGEARWLTFHGLYDLAHLVPLFTGRPLPELLFDFVNLVEMWFGRVFDIKSMAGPYRHMLGTQNI